MLSIEDVFGLELMREPATMPGTTFFSKQSPDHLKM